MSQRQSALVEELPSRGPDRGDGPSDQAGGTVNVTAPDSDRPGDDQTAQTEDMLDSKGRVMSRRARRRMKRAHLHNQGGADEKPKKQRKPNPDPGYSKPYFSETDYIFEKGLRKVVPYHFTFETHAKRRWVKRSLMDILMSEFRFDNAEAYKKAVEQGRIKINGQSVSPDYIVRDNDLISNTIHRHESCVTADPIQIIEQTDDIVVVNKPSSIPVHPCGRYRHNSVVFILGKEHNLTNLRTIYRLDRMTSGVLMFARTHEKTKELMEQMKKRVMKKTYVCRVVGEFPSGVIECSEPIDVLSHKVGLFRVAPSGKESKTTFERLSFNGKSSVVKCQPHTGRTHQIRVHLQYLGYPIVNDNLYNTPVWGPTRGKGGILDKTEEQLIEDIIRLHNRENHLEYATEDTDSGQKNHKVVSDSEMCADKPDTVLHNTETIDSKVIITNRQKTDVNMEDEDKLIKNTVRDDGDSDNKDSNTSCSPAIVRSEPVTESSTGSLQTHSNHHSPCENETTGEQPSQERSGLDLAECQTSGSDCPIVDPDCRDCRERYKDPDPADLVMYLHALSYEGPNWKYSTDLPEWAKEDWKE